MLSIASGLPFLLIVSTLSVWMFKAGISKTDIGLLAWVSVPYVFKFIWAPILDQYHLPFLTKYIGHRRSWMLFSQLLLVLSLIALSSMDPEVNLKTFAICAFLVGVCSASQDINIEAYRIEILSKEELNYGASASVLGYRIGMLISGAGALYLSHFFSWQIVYLIMAFTVSLGMIVTLKGPSPCINRETVEHQFDKFLTRVVIEPAKKLINGSEILIIIMFIMSFKFSDTVLNSMSMPFLIELGFSEIEIANVAKTFGICAMIFGSILGGWSLIKIGLRNSLFLCTLFQLIASGFFIIQSVVGYDINLLFLSMFIENITTGIAQVTLISYLSSFCHVPYAGTHYAMLSSISSCMRVFFSMCAGFLADKFFWPQFYLFVLLSCIPSIFILYYFSNHFDRNCSVDA